MIEYAILLFYICCTVALAVVDASDFGGLGLNLLADPQDAEFDIIAIHGLDGHWRNSWTSGDGVFWLQDLLPIRVPQARIYSYSHDSRTRGGEVPFTLDMSDHGIALVRDLTIERGLTATERRPIIFIAHSLGGLIVKSVRIPHLCLCRIGSPIRPRVGAEHGPPLGGTLRPRLPTQPPVGISLLLLTQNQSIQRY
ncbi:hypothetical protein BDP81DRAFT_384530 [Colletotrichum phormii]|uniref:Protein SERAC1 n=1 Tax=Colletotrichum phormii TaxID=359342 RepID=A0AAJ0E9A0_9PEZI|nr:uncharacterized protein BDP81DRAFT_384530 [Colletotrichum phormii]KAK1623386.1 hypothetical protein BDP81DRAFT_384530 [Colletotrichum phormii]